MSPAPGPRQAEGLYRRLLGAYGPQGWWPLRSRAGKRGFDDRGYHPGIWLRSQRPPERFEIAVGAVLTQNTSWRNVEPGIDALLLLGLLDPAALLACPERRLALHIRSCGYHNQKARKLRVLADWFRRGAAGAARRTGLRGELLTLWGVGPETADSVALYAFGQPSFVVDAYTLRILARLGWVSAGASYGEVQRLFLSSLASEAPLFGEYHALLVRHAKEHCRTRPVCAGCPLRRAAPDLTPCSFDLTRAGKSVSFL